MTDFNLINNVSRRRFLQSVTTLVTAFVVPRMTYSVSNDKDWKKIIKNLSEYDSLRNIGENYLHSLNEPPSIDSLVSSLKSGSLSSLDEGASEVEIFDIINKAIRNDFDKNNITTIDNWYLSDTEVKLCALATLAV